MPSYVSAGLLYVAAAIDAFCIFGHSQLGHTDVFPSLKLLGPSESGMIRIVWQECNLVFAIMAIMCAKWASTGLTSQYDQAMLGLVVAGQAYFGWRYTQIGLYSPLAALALAPGLTIASQFV